MTRPAPLPASLLQTPFAVADARELGVSPSRLRADDLEMPTRGVRLLRAPAAGVPLPVDETPTARMQRLRAELLERARRFAPALTEDQFVSHGSGLAIIGAPIPYTSANRLDLHVSARRPKPQPARRGVIGHRLQVRPPDRLRVHDLPIEHPARMWRQAASTWNVDDLIAAGDFLIHPRNALATIEDLWNELDEAGDVRGRLKRALPEIREGAESAQETALRLAIIRAGLPEPELNWCLYDHSGRFVARLDLAYPEYRVASEYDGRQHAEAEQFARDADRWESIRVLDWQLVRILSHHLRPDPQIAVDKVASALIAAGWRPGRR